VSLSNRESPPPLLAFDKLRPNEIIGNHFDKSTYRCLNHVEQNKLKRIYQRHELKAEQRGAWRLLGERLSLLLDPEQQGNVVIGRFAQKAS